MTVLRVLLGRDFDNHGNEARLADLERACAALAKLRAGAGDYRASALVLTEESAEGSRAAPSELPAAEAP